MGRLNGKVAIVTGAGRMRGIGRAIALRLADDGAATVVTAVARPAESFPEHEREAGWRGVESVAKEIRDAGGKALALDVDVTKPEQVREMVERTKAEFGRIDILVNNHGLALVSGKKDLWQVDDDEWYREIDVNLHGVYHTCRAVAPVLIEQGEGGRIINMSSLAGRLAQPQYGGYTPAKFAVIGLTQMLARELAPYRVTVNALCPGVFKTEINRPILNDPEYLKDFLRQVPLGYLGEPHQLAGAVVFLASEASSYMTGSALVVDGGWTTQ